jgi:hypothetical protein
MEARGLGEGEAAGAAGGMGWRGGRNEDSGASRIAVSIPTGSCEPRWCCRGR